jgi:hypothetical protein
MGVFLSSVQPTVIKNVEIDRMVGEYQGQGTPDVVVMRKARKETEDEVEKTRWLALGRQGRGELYR